jgi:hypothetical protein
MTTESTTLVPVAQNPAPIAAPVPAPAVDNAPPAQPATGEPAPLSLDPAPAPAPGPVTYDPTGDPALDLALDFVGNLGFGPDHPAMAAASEGNFELLRAEMKRLGDKAKGWEKFVAAGEAAYANQKSQKESAAEKTRAAVMSVMGDEATWASVQSWAAENADPAEKTAVNAAFAAGGVQAKAMALYLKQCYDNAGGSRSKPQGASMVQQQTSTSPGTAALSPRAYVAAVAELRARNMGRDIDDSAEYAALRARRAAWRG